MAEETVKEVSKEEVVESKDNFEIEIVDDTPEEDRNRVPLKVDDDFDSTIQEMEDYDKNNKSEISKRIKQLTRLRHDERRAKEAKEREAREAYNYAKSLQEENRKLKENLSKGENVLMEESKARADAELAAAKEQYRQAYEEGDSEKVVTAQEKMTTAAVNQEKWNSYVSKHNPEANQQNTLQNGEDAVYNPS